MPPAVLIGIAIASTLASTAASLKAQSDQTEAAKDLQNRQIDASNKEMETNRTLATKSFLNQTYQNAQGLVQSREAAADEAFRTAIKGKQARGAAAVSAAGGGVEGLGIQSLIADFHRQEAMFNANLKTNLDYREQRFRTNNEELAGQYSGRIASVKPFVPTPITGPNYFGEIAGMTGSMSSLASGIKMPTGSTPNTGSVPGMQTPAFSGDDAGYGTGA